MSGGRSDVGGVSEVADRETVKDWRGGLGLGCALKHGLAHMFLSAQLQYGSVV